MSVMHMVRVVCMNKNIQHYTFYNIASIKMENWKNSKTNKYSCLARRLIVCNAQIRRKLIYLFNFITTVLKRNFPK